ncbi:MAG: hypothetical protein HQK97_09210 [Nitrospirae bacterium]|nr:hypothetical protein [Nitrospirota bacterium]
MSSSSSTAKVNTSFSVSFAASCSSASESIKDEAADDKNVDESGNKKSCFKYGEKYYFRIYKTSGIAGYNFTVSDGTITSEGSGKSIDKSEDLEFKKTDTANTSFPITSITSMTWMGTSLGAVKKSGDEEIQTETSGVAVGTLKYTSTYDLWSISVATRDADTYKVMVYVEETT